MSQVHGASMDASVTISYTGWSLLPIQALAWQQANNTGWFYADPIAAAVQNGSQDVTGFKFVASTTNWNLNSFALGGNFGMLTNLLFANYPTIEIQYANADFNTFSQNWSEKWTGNLKLFDLISLGSFSQGAYGNSLKEGADNSSFTVSFSASPQVITVPTLQQQAFVLGCAVSNPAVAASLELDELLTRLASR